MQFWAASATVTEIVYLSAVLKDNGKNISSMRLS